MRAKRGRIGRPFTGNAAPLPPPMSAINFALEKSYPSAIAGWRLSGKFAIIASTARSGQPTILSGVSVRRSDCLP
jgi:hypothetical protein